MDGGTECRGRGRPAAGAAAHRHLRGRRSRSASIFSQGARRVYSRHGAVDGPAVAIAESAPALTCPPRPAWAGHPTWGQRAAGCRRGHELAPLLPSLGPCYSAAVTGLQDVYASQSISQDRFQDAVEWPVLPYQHVLREGLVSGQRGTGGVSPRPRPQTTLLLACLCWRRPWTRVLALTSVIVTFRSSFLQEWHCAVGGLRASPLVVDDQRGAKHPLQAVGAAPS